MKNLSLIIWLTQLALSVISPLLGFVLLAIWLRNSRGWGGWVIWVGIAFGAYFSIRGLIDSLHAMEKHAKRNLDSEVDPPLSFNDHE